MPVITLTYRDDYDDDTRFIIEAGVPASPLANDYLKVFQRKLEKINFGYAELVMSVHVDTRMPSVSHHFALKRNRELPHEDQYKTGRCILRNFCDGFNFANTWFHYVKEEGTDGSARPELPQRSSTPE